MSYYCGGGMTDIGSYHQEHWAPQIGKPPKWCHGDPSRKYDTLEANRTGDTVETQGYCPYCQQNTTWLLTVKEPGVINFACQRCKKIERDVILALSDPGGQ